MRRTIGGVLVVCALALAACGSSDTPDAGSPATTAAKKPTASGAPATTAAPTSAAESAPTAAVIFTYIYSDSDPYFRSAAEIKNPASQTRVGVRTTWKALDANGVIVGTLENSEQPAIPAGGSIYYVAGAGWNFLTGIPGSVEFEISDPGTLSAESPAVSATAENPTFKRADFDSFSGARSYDMSFVIVAAQDVKTDSLSAVILLKDAEGNIVGANWASTDDLPSAMKAGEKAKMTSSVEVEAGDPMTAEAHVYG